MVSGARPCDRGDARVRVLHRDAERGVADQLEVVEPVAHGCGLGGVDPVATAEVLDRGPLVHAAGEGLEQVGLAADRLLRRQRRPVLGDHGVAEPSVDLARHLAEHGAEGDRSDADGVLVRVVLVDRLDAPVLDRQVVEPPRGRRVERLVPHHDVVDPRLGVVLQEMREMSVLGEHRGDPAHDLGRERPTEDNRPVARIVHERSASGDGMALVVDVVEDMVALAQRPSGRRDDLDAGLLQPADRLEVPRAHPALSVEERPVEIGHEEPDAHGRENTLYPAPVSIQPASSAPATPLHAADGAIVVDACEAILKGALESQVAVGAVAVPNADRFAGFARALASESAQKLLARHQTELLVGGDGARAVALAIAAVRSGRSGVAVVPSSDLVVAVEALRDARTRLRDPEHGLAIVLEDDAVLEPMLCPRRLATDAGLAVLEVPDLSSLRDAIEQALRLSRAGAVPAAVIAHSSLLSSIETILARPNRVVTNVDELILQRRLRAGARAADTGDLLRVARRLELNPITSLPSPGEREVIGFIAVGVCERALAHVLGELGLSARVPVLRLGLIAPVDEAPLQRLIDRVQQVVLLEPRPGSAAPAVLSAVEGLRRRGVRVPPVLTRDLPPRADGTVETLAVGDGCLPSVLVRRVIHLLHAVRPSLAVATRLEQGDESLESLEVPPRDAALGLGGAIASVRAMLVEVDQEIRARMAPEDIESGVRALAIESLPPRSDAAGIVAVEILVRRRFIREGAEAVRQAARDRQRRVFAVVDLGGGDGDLARLADAAIPPGAGVRVHIERVDLNDSAAVRARLLAAAEFDGVTVLLLGDGPPARIDPASVERGFQERDRLGYLPQQRLVWNADMACEIRPPALSGLLSEAEERGATPIQGSFSREDLGTRVDGIQFRATTISEQVEVLRTKPPITSFRRGSVGLAPPRAVHGEQGIYRAHLAGFRTATPGVAARILLDAGRTMGYRVEVCASDEPCGRGRRAWAQVLFVKMRGDEPRAPRTGAIPYGEADLLLGSDAVETLRAIGPDPALRIASPARTAVVANAGPLEDQFNDADLRACAELDSAVSRCGVASQSLLADFASLCRTSLLSERLVDVVLLGAAFQRGLIPVSLDAMESAVRRAEAAGVGRSVEAFNFGRRAEGGGLARRSVEEGESLERLVRRLALELVRERFGGRRRAERFALSASGMIAAFARFGGGGEADRAARVVVTALHRSIVWGGTRMMRLYEGLVSRLLRADPSGDLAILAAEPLADALLVRDAMYVLTMSTSLEQRRRVRERLGVRASHGDTLERRFLSRLEVLAGTRRFRLDFRSSDWPAEVVRIVRPLVPWSLRGDPRAQEIRAYAISLAERAARGFEADGVHWSMCMHRFATLASDNGLRSLTAAELRVQVEGL